MDTYLAVWKVSESPSLRARINACGSKEGIPEVEGWTFSHRWEYAAAPGWGAAFASAEAAGNTDPGASEDVITDAMVLSQVQAMLDA